MKKSRNSIVDQEAAAFRRVQARSAGAEERLLNEEGGALTATKFASMLDLSVDELPELCMAHRMFNVPWNGQLRYPAWQVHYSRLLPGLGDLLKVLIEQHQFGPLSVVLFFLTPAEALRGSRPLDLLRKLRVDEVVKHASSPADIIPHSAS